MAETDTELNNELLKNALRGLKAIHEEIQTVNGLMRLSNESSSHIGIKHDSEIQTLKNIEGYLLVNNELLGDLAESTRAIQSSCAVIMPTMIRILNCLEKCTEEKGSL